MIQVPYAVVSACWTTTVNAIGGVFASKNLLSEPGNVNPGDFDRHSRTGQIEYQMGAQGEFSMVSKEGVEFTGLPVIGFAARKYVNGDIGGVRANYGRIGAHKYVSGAPQ